MGFSECIDTILTPSLPQSVKFPVIVPEVQVAGYS